MSESTVFVATRTNRKNRRKQIAIASFFSFEDLRKFCEAEIAVNGPEGWFSDPMFAPTQWGYKSPKNQVK